MQWLASVSVRRPVFATVMILFITVVGIVGYNKLSVDRFPKVEIPLVSIVTRLDGASPEQIETEVTDKIEEAVNTISAIDELRSISNEGVSQVFIAFLLEKNIDVASQEVRDRLSTVLPLLPKGTDPPVVSKVDPDAAPVLFVALNADKPIRDITELADQRVRRSLENVPGVGQVSIVGGRKRQVQVRLDPIKLRAAGLTAVDVQRAINAQNVTTPGGVIETGPGRLMMRVKGRVDSIPALGDIVVRQQEHHSITINDVGRVLDGEEQLETLARNDGKPAVILSIRKQSGENSVAVV
ncbi:MAG TPA: efflux RND transporter permease subunit, partial [Polyangia bacterium]